MKEAGRESESPEETVGRVRYFKNFIEVQFTDHKVDPF